MKALLLILAFAFTAPAQTQEPTPERRLIEINASMSAIQELIDDLNLKKAALERERLDVLRRIAGQTEAEFGNRVLPVVRVAGERTVIFWFKGQEREAYLSAVQVKTGQGDNAVSFLKHELLSGNAYVRCTEQHCIEIELFTDRDKPSLNCQLFALGIAIRAGASDVTCAESPKATTGQPDKSFDPEAPTPSATSTPGTEVQVKGYYRKDGTYVRPHTRSAPRKHAHAPEHKRQRQTER